MFNYLNVVFRLYSYITFELSPCHNTSIIGIAEVMVLVFALKKKQDFNFTLHCFYLPSNISQAKYVFLQTKYPNTRSHYKSKFEYYRVNSSISFKNDP